MDSADAAAGGENTAWFARIGGELLERGDAAGGMRVCAAGIERYPWYATGHVVLGRCLESLGRTSEAVIAFRRALVVFPDATMIRRALKDAEKREQQEFGAYISKQRPETTSIGLTFEEYIRGTSVQEEGSAGFLQKQALSARHEEETRPAAGASEPPEIPGIPDEPEKIVTVTLAEIYATQGEYREAIDAYRVLKTRRPAEAGRFDERIRELEELAEKEKPLE